MTRPGFDMRWSKSCRRYGGALKSSYASIANCKTRRDAPVAATANNHCATRIIKSVLFMCVYPLTDRTEHTMRRPPIHNKRTI